MSRSLTHAQALLLGLVVLLGLALAGVGIFAVGDRQWLWSDTFHLTAGFPQIRGVEAGTEVRVQGIKAGMVERVEAPSSPGGNVILHLKVAGSLRQLIRADATVQIVNEGMIGGKALEIDPGSSAAPPVTDHTQLASRASPELNDVLVRVNAALDDIRNGQATLVKLVKDPRAYSDLLALLQQSKGTMVSFQQDADALKNSPHRSFSPMFPSDYRDWFCGQGGNRCQPPCLNAAIAAASVGSRVPEVAIRAAAKRFQRPNLGEGFDRLDRVHAESGRFALMPFEGDDPARTIFLVSPASTHGERAALLFNDRSSFTLAAKLRRGPGVPLGEVFSFLSSLYFRGKLTYAQAFGRPPAGLCSAFVITPGEGLRDPAERVTIGRLRKYAEIPVKSAEPRYLKPLRRDAEALRVLAGARCRFVLLGSVASARYVEPLLAIFGDRLFFPPAFVGRGDMSRGGVLLRCVAEGTELDYAPVAGAERHGPRPPRLPRRTR